MSELMLINPRERRRTRRRSSESRATRSRVARSESRNARGQFTRRRRNPESRAERSAAARRGWSHRRRNPSVREHARRVYRHSKPRFAEIGETFMHGAVGAGGGLALDILMAKIPLPATLKVGVAHTATKAVGAVLLGMLGQRFMSPTMANSLAIGTMATVLHDAGREVLAPHIAMADLGYYSAGWPVGGDATPLALQEMGDVGEYVAEATEPGLSEYVQDLGF